MNNSTGNYIIAFIDNCRLPRRNTAHRMLKMHMQAIIHGGEYALHTGVTVPYLGYCFHPGRYFGILAHIQAADYHFALLQFMGLAQYHGIGFRQYIGYEHRLAKSNIQPLALPYGIEGVAIVLAHYSAVGQYKVATLYTVFQSVHIPFQETTVVIIRHKADLLALRLGRKLFIAHIGRQLPYFGF